MYVLVVFLKHINIPVCMDIWEINKIRVVSDSETALKMLEGTYRMGSKKMKLNIDEEVKLIIDDIHWICNV